MILSSILSVVGVISFKSDFLEENPNPSVSAVIGDNSDNPIKLLPVSNVDTGNSFETEFIQQKIGNTDLIQESIEEPADQIPYASASISGYEANMGFSSERGNISFAGLNP